MYFLFHFYSILIREAFLYKEFYNFKYICIYYISIILNNLARIIDLVEKVPVTCLTKKFSDFHYFFFYAEEPNLSFYSEYSATTEGYQRLFEAGRGSACFERNSKGFSENGIYYKWGGAFIQLDSEDIQALE
ncbi:hypothetical protein COX24_00455, partial [bacterium (Candidatus Gribaldobacteria) CG23_combo_of_CG06-09_8_20_14_all_37_87_8]